MHGHAFVYRACKVHQILKMYIFIHLYIFGHGIKHGITETCIHHNVELVGNPE